MIKKVIIDSETRRLEKMFGEGNVLVADYSRVPTIYLVTIIVGGVTFEGQGNFEDADAGELRVYALNIGHENCLKKLYDKLEGQNG